MYAEYYQATRDLKPYQLIEIKYEDLVKDPVTVVGNVYGQLGLPDYDKVVPKIQALQQDRADYKTNKFELDPATRAKIRERWAHYFEHFGYP
jgi:LPS sulfotransferase NodH